MDLARSTLGGLGDVVDGFGIGVGESSGVGSIGGGLP